MEQRSAFVKHQSSAVRAWYLQCRSPIVYTGYSPTGQVYRTGSRPTGRLLAPRVYPKHIEFVRFVCFVDRTPYAPCLRGEYS